MVAMRLSATHCAKVLSRRYETVPAEEDSAPITAASRGNWNSKYPDVYPIDFSSLTTSGAYHVAVSGKVAATSDNFQIESAADLYGALVTDGVQFYQNQRDGSDQKAIHGGKSS